MWTYFVIFGAFTAAAIAANLYDISWTLKGLKAGVAVEAFDWLIGDKPSATALVLRDALVMSFVVAPSAVSYYLGNTPLAYGALTAQVVVIIKHIQGANAWKRLLK